MVKDKYTDVSSSSIVGDGDAEAEYADYVAKRAALEGGATTDKPAAVGGWATLAALTPFARLSWPTRLLFLTFLLTLVGYLTYTQVEGSKTFWGRTLNTNVNLQQGLVGHWTFDGPDMSTSTAFDVSGNGNHADLINAPTRSIGKVGQGLGFNGSDQSILVSAASELNNLPGLTISAWVKTNSLTVGQHIVNKASGASNPSNGWILDLIISVDSISL